MSKDRKSKAGRLRPLVINNAVRKSVEKVIAYSKNPHRRMDNETLRKICSGEIQWAAGDDSNHVTIIPVGFRVVYNHEEQNWPHGWCRHISISLLNAESGMTPHPAAVNEILNVFGFGKTYDKCLRVWFDSETNSVNIVDPLPV